jgi:uncharacterized phage protein gp47/JayE
VVSQQAIDYTSKDFDGFLVSMRNYAATNFPQWSQASEGDLGVVILEALAYCLDILSYYGDRISQESFLATATQKRSILNLASMYGYRPSNPIPAVGTVKFETEDATDDTLIPAGTQVSTEFNAVLDEPIVFETNDDVIVPGAGGSVNARVTQGRTVIDEVVGTSDGTISQAYRLFNSPVIQLSVSVDVGSDAGWDRYTPIEHLLDAGPQDPVFLLYTDENDVSWMAFGDGINGRVPSAGATIKATYRIGGGIVGNVNEGLVSYLITPIDGVHIATDALGVAQTSAMDGGADAESVEEIRANAPRAFRTQDRCVTLTDYSDTALGVSGVNKAVAVGNHYSSISVFCAGPRGTLPSQATLARAQASIQAKAQLGTTVSVLPAQLVRINVSLAVFVTDRYSQTQVKNEVVKAIQNYLGYNQQEFGQRVPLSAMYRNILNVPGVDYCTISLMARADGTSTSADDIVVRDWELPTFGTITITNVTGGVNEAAAIAF